MSPIRSEPLLKLLCSGNEPVQHEDSKTPYWNLFVLSFSTIRSFLLQARQDLSNMKTAAASASRKFAGIAKNFIQDLQRGY